MCGSFFVLEKFFLPDQSDAKKKAAKSVLQRKKGLFFSVGICYNTIDKSFFKAQRKPLSDTAQKRSGRRLLCVFREVRHFAEREKFGPGF